MLGAERAHGRGASSPSTRRRAVVRPTISMYAPRSTEARRLLRATCTCTAAGTSDA
jgi:hypothetical protein